MRPEAPANFMDERKGPIVDTRSNIFSNFTEKTDM